MRKTRPYFLTLHLHPSATAKERETVEKAICSWIEEQGGHVDTVRYEEKRRLAYEIRHTGQVTEMGVIFSMPPCPTDDLRRQLLRRKNALRLRIFGKPSRSGSKTLKDALEKQQDAPAARVPKEKASIEKLDEKIDEILEEKIL